MSIADRMSANLAWDTLTVPQWHALLIAVVREGDFETVPVVLNLMAVHGHPQEAEDARELLLLGCALNEGDAS